MKDLIITLPKKIKWVDYQKELDDVINECLDINFKVPFHPKEYEFGKTKVYLTHEGIIKGYMILKALRTFTEDWICDTSGTIMGAGKYLVRSGEFFECEEKVPYKGFQGFRYIDYDNLEFVCNKCHEWTGPAYHSGCDKNDDPNCAWHVKR